MIHKPILQTDFYSNEFNPDKVLGGDCTPPKKKRLAG